jgi:hypothetical protein
VEFASGRVEFASGRVEFASGRVEFASGRVELAVDLFLLCDLYVRHKLNLYQTQLFTKTFMND